MTELTTQNDYTLTNLGSINIILGKNGAGKSNLLRDIENPETTEKSSSVGNIRYITPERGGVLLGDAGVNQNMQNNSDWRLETRRQNQVENFKQQSVGLFTRLETLVNREISRKIDTTSGGEMDDLKPDLFKGYISRINSLLDYIEIKEDGQAFKILKKGSVEELGPKIISSGESELITLAIEILFFDKEKLKGKTNILCLDEPDVHLHPDLQIRLMKFLQVLIEDEDIMIFIATHSTALLSSLTEESSAKIAFKEHSENDLKFTTISDEYKKILPIFGAHPLTNTFNQKPIFLVEGDDEVRIWQQVVRSTEGRIALYPCSTDSVDKMHDYEKIVEDIAGAIYEQPKAYSLRDSDGLEPRIDNMKIIRRNKLRCRTSENLIISDEVLTLLGSTWLDLEEAIDKWLEIDDNRAHQTYDILKRFKKEGYNRMSFELKPLRSSIMHLLGSNKPWEVAVGQTIASIAIDENTDYNKDGSIISFLGEKLVKDILLPAQDD